MLPKPLGTGTKGIDSLTEAPAAALSVASPPTATRCENSDLHVSDHSSRLSRLRKACTRTSWPRRLKARPRRRVMKRARPSPDPGVTTICTTERIRKLAAVVPGDGAGNPRSRGEKTGRRRAPAGHRFRVRRSDRALYFGAMLI